jgi:glycosyltransferase involved in cell wall biosynthesis
MDLNLSVIIPWCNRNELRTTLTGNASWMAEHAAEVVIVNCSGNSACLRRLVAEVSIQNLRCVEVPAPRFNRSLTLNVGIYYSRSPKLFVLDCDIEVRPDVLSEVLRLLNGNVFVTFTRVEESRSDWNSRSAALRRELPLRGVCDIESVHTIEFKWSDGTRNVIDLRRNLINGSRSGTGNIFANKNDLVMIDGYNSDLELWGWEDNDLQLRLMRVLTLKHYEYGEAFHISHEDNVRALYGVDRRQASLSNLRTACWRYANGNLRGTYSRDVAHWKSFVREL